MQISSHPRIVCVTVVVDLISVENTKTFGDYYKIMSDLLMDLITDILLRLPVRSLLCFRSVSKSWCELIDSSDFIKLHLNQSIEKKANCSLIVKDWQLYAIDFDLLDKAVELDHPLKNSCTTSVLGSCNGLLLLGNTEKDIAIWNYSTRKNWKLPESPIQPPSYTKYIQYVIYGFGYDSMSDDYKVLRVVQFYCDDEDSFSSEVKVYSLRSNSWRRIQNFPYYICFSLGWGGVYVSGALHWVVKKSRDANARQLIVAFALGSEEYREVPEPSYLDGCFQMGLEVFEGCLCVTCSYHKDCLDIWVMKDYVVKESWMKLLAVVPPNIRTFEYVKPIAYSKSGCEILMNYDDKRLIWYDLTGKKLDEADVKGLPYSFSAEVSVGSLVSFNDYRSDGSQQHALEKGKEKKGVKSRDDMADFLSEGFKLVL